MSAIVKVDTRSYRQIAQENWGLTDEQMKGMHVHHRIPRSKEGTNDPSNLYVCSPWFHAHVWHGEDSCHPMVVWASEAGRKGDRTGKSLGGKIGGKTGGKTQGNRNVESGHLASIRTFESRSKGGKVGGKIGGRKNVESGHLDRIRAYRYKCLVTGYITTAGPLSRYQKARGIDTSLREKVHNNQ